MNAHPTGIHTQDQVAAIHASESATAIRDYLDLMEDSEAPRAFLVWSLIAAAAGLLGRNSAFYSGATHVVRPNLFVVLIGPSGIRKSSAINATVKLLNDTTLNFGPNDTGGQRHGLMSALTGLHRLDGKPWRHKPSLGPMSESMLRPRSPSDIFLVAPELGRLMGIGNREMADFLVDLYDGASIDYQTKAGETRVRSPLATLLGGTVPSSLASILPDNAASHGILSRIIFIFEDKIHKIVPLPPEPTEDWWDKREKLVERLRWIDGIRQDMGLDTGARQAYIGLYEYRPAIEDPRLESYTARRADTLIKVSMCLAALRTDTTVIESDVLLAHELLHAAEPRMHRALEYFGRNKTYQGRMLMIQFLKSLGAAGTASHAELASAAASELNRREADEAIEAMVTSGELTRYGDVYVLGTSKNAVIEANRRRAKNAKDAG